MSGFRDVALAVAWRSLVQARKNPALFMPALIFPLFFFVAFAGGLSAVGDAPGFDYPAGYTAFQFVFVLLQSSAFGGVFGSFTLAADFENGFSRRLLLAAPHRSAIVAGIVLASLVRATIVMLLLTAVALAAGMRMAGGPIEIAGLYALAYSTVIVASLFGAGVALRARTLQAGPAIQMPVFVAIFLTPVFVPLELLEGWIEAVASINPATFVLEAARDQLAGLDAAVLRAYGAIAVLLAVMLAWAVTGMRAAERSGA